MSKIKNYISRKNENAEKVLSVFLTSGFPDPDSFTELALKILNAGADMLEIGFPFSDPLADGPIIQESSKISLNNGINLEKTIEYISQIKDKTEKPILLMGYSNPVLSFGLERFADKCKDCGVDGLIIPDVPLDEFDNFYTREFNEIEKVLLISPTTPVERIKLIDNKSEGFVYCVSANGITGLNNENKNVDFIKKSYDSLVNNKMLVGFGISNVNDAIIYSKFSDGIIVGSAIIKSLMHDYSDYSKTIDFVKDLKSVLKNTG